jgi:hypothetical protein
MRIVTAEHAAVVRAGLAEMLADHGHEVGAAEAVKAAVAEHRRRRLPAHRPGGAAGERVEKLADGAAGGTALDPGVITEVATCQLQARARPWAWGRPRPSPRYRRRVLTYRI